MNVRKLYYFVRRGFPGSRANHIQSAMMCDAFRSVGVDTTVVAPMETGESTEQVAERFGLRAPLDTVVLAHPPAIANWTPVRDWIIRRALHSFVGGLNGIRGQTVLYGRTSRNYPMAQLLDRSRSPEGEKVVCEVHDAEMSDAWVRRLARADSLIVISRALRDWMIERGIDGERVLVAPDGVDLRRYDSLRFKGVTDLRTELGLPADRPLVGYTGSLNGDRGTETLVRAVRHFPPEAFLVIAGGRKADSDALRRIARAEGVEGRVIFVGHRPHAEVAAFQMAMNTLVMAYTPDLATQRWCSPLKMFEYMASGRPIVTSDIPALHEILKHEENALFVPPGNTAALGGAIARLLGDSSLARTLSERALNDVRQYSWDERARRILEFALVGFPSQGLPV
ncbi:MAG TPA: glycosyltransferase family 4 protein [Planctomycetota bacterium]|nr:glycosyltransferase family 4 protein [Planctomycetota bacterium]